MDTTTPTPDQVHLDTKLRAELVLSATQKREEAKRLLTEAHAIEKLVELADEITEIHDDTALRIFPWAGGWSVHLAGRHTLPWAQVNPLVDGTYALSYHGRGYRSGGTLDPRRFDGPEEPLALAKAFAAAQAR